MPCHNGCINCHEDPDAVDKIEWKCVHGCNLKKDFEAKQKRAEQFYKNQEKLQIEATVKATEAYNKVFKESFKVTDR